MKIQKILWLIVFLFAFAGISSHNASAEETIVIRQTKQATPLVQNDFITSVTTVPKGESIQLLGRQNGWGEIIYKGMQGYVQLSSLRTAQATPMLVHSKNEPIVRTTPSSQATQLGTFYKNSIVFVYPSIDNNWVFAQYGNQVGYIVDAAVTTPKKQKVIATDNLPIYATASSQHEEITIIPKGTAVELYTSLAGWSFIATTDVYGYVKESGLKKIPTVNPGKYAYGVVTKQKRVALTFDDGPHPTVTNRILKTLEKYDAKATFFMVGYRVEQNPKVAQQVAIAGHEIGNHSYNHPDLTRLSTNKMTWQIERTNRLIEQTTGSRPTVFRPPYGAYTQSIVKISNMPTILWSVDTLDWKHRNPTKILQSIQKSSRNGSIILMHDIHSTTADALDNVLSNLTKQGYTMVTVSELLSN